MKNNFVQFLLIFSVLGQVTTAQAIPLRFHFPLLYSGERIQFEKYASSRISELNSHRDYFCSDEEFIKSKKSIHERLEKQRCAYESERSKYLKDFAIFVITLVIGSSIVMVNINLDKFIEKYREHNTENSIIKVSSLKMLVR